MTSQEMIAVSWAEQSSKRSIGKKPDLKIMSDNDLYCIIREAASIPRIQEATRMARQLKNDIKNAHTGFIFGDIWCMNVGRSMVDGRPFLFDAAVAR